MVAKELGITARSLRRWLNKGRHECERRERHEKPNDQATVYFMFYMDVQSAMSEAENRAVFKITQSEDWRAHLAYLERKFPRRWGKQINITIEREYNRMLNKLEKLLDPDTYDLVLEAMAMDEDLVGTEEHELDESGEDEDEE